MSYIPTKVYLLIEAPHHEEFKNYKETLVYTEHYCLIPNYIWYKFKSQDEKYFDELAYAIWHENNIPNENCSNNSSESL